MDLEATWEVMTLLQEAGRSAKHSKGNHPRENVGGTGVQFTPQHNGLSLFSTCNEFCSIWTVNGHTYGTALWIDNPTEEYFSTGAEGS